jgi:hypothetical protein
VKKGISCTPAKVLCCGSTWANAAGGRSALGRHVTGGRRQYARAAGDWRQAGHQYSTWQDVEDCHPVVHLQVMLR